jgi:radical SAM superfamily enzyme YgiQ (UPF0313 family)
MRLLLLSPPYLPGYVRNGRCDYVSWSHTYWYPIWLSYCGALLEKYGHKVELIDAPAERLEYKTSFKKILDFSPQILVVYSSTKSKESDIIFSDKVKEAIGCYIVFVGPYVSLEPEVILNSSDKIDAVVRGEFDYPILELANGLEKPKIKNLIWKQSGQVISNESRPFLNRKELDDMPFVSEFYLRHLNIKNYRAPSQLYPFVDIFTGRGCIWGKCLFCLWPQSFIKGSVYNTRSIENLIEELKFIKEKMLYVKEIFIQDDTLPHGRIIELAKGFLNNNLDIIWSCYARADLDYKTLKLMKESGCRTIHVGYESQSNLVLKNIQKGLTSEKMAEFTSDAKRAGLRIHGDFLIGLPGETKTTIKKTIEWAKKINPETAQFLLINLYPATGLYKFLAENGWIKDGEPSYPDLTREELSKLVKYAYREFYFSFNTIKKITMHPYIYLFSQHKAITKSIVNLLKAD